MKLRWAEELRDSVLELAESLRQSAGRDVPLPGAVCDRRGDGLGGGHGLSRHGREGPYHGR